MEIKDIEKNIKKVLPGVNWTVEYDGIKFFDITKKMRKGGEDVEFKTTVKWTRVVFDEIELLPEEIAAELAEFKANYGQD